MSRLAEKGLLARTLVGKGYEYQATSTQAEFLAQLSSERVKALLQEFGDLALSQFLGHLEQLDSDHRRRLLDLAWPNAAEA